MNFRNGLLTIIICAMAGLSFAQNPVSATLAAGLDGAMLEVHLDSLNGAKLATINVPRTGAWNTWQTFTETVSSQVSGIHDVYFSFKGKNITAGRELFNFDSWIFKR